MNSIYLFKKEITKKYKKLDNEKLIQLRNENKIDELVNSLLPLVIYISNKYYYGCDFEEIVSVGNEGLLKGIEKFDISKGNNIISVCNSHIRYTILDYLSEKNNLIRLPLSNRKIVSQRTIDLYPTVSYTEDITNFDCEYDDYVEPKIIRKEIEDLLMTIPKMKYSKVTLFLDYYLIPGMTYGKVSEKNGFTKQNTSLIIVDMLKKIKNNPTILEKFREVLLP